MKTRTETSPRLRGDFLLVTLFLVTIAIAKPGPAEAGVVIRAGIGPVTVVAGRSRYEGFLPFFVQNARPVPERDR